MSVSAVDTSVLAVDFSVSKKSLDISDFDFALAIYQDSLHKRNLVTTNLYDIYKNVDYATVRSTLTVLGYYNAIITNRLQPDKGILDDNYKINVKIFNDGPDIKFGYPPITLGDVDKILDNLKWLFMNDDDNDRIVNYSYWNGDTMSTPVMFSMKQFFKLNLHVIAVLDHALNHNGRKNERQRIPPGYSQHSKTGS